MTIFVTGGSGFVGLNLLEALLDRGDSVVSLSLSPPPERAKRVFDRLPGTLRHVNGDVRHADPPLNPGRRAPLSIKRSLRDTAYNPHFGLEGSFDDYLEWMEA